ncbi:MAG: hypothetical protein NT062_32600, partial [Proteobacteria bacterium]|nr:hypothetical protein [Pseudomonadota bacterium]
TIVASGTSPTEYATGPTARTLAAAWDKLGLRVKSIEATTYGKDHAIGLVVVSVGLPYKQKAAPMTLYAIVTRDDKGAWRWSSLQWATALARPPVAGPESRETTNEPTRKR